MYLESLRQSYQADYRYNYVGRNRYGLSNDLLEDGPLARSLILTIPGSVADIIMDEKYLVKCPYRIMSGSF